MTAQVMDNIEMVDLAFTIVGGALPRGYRQALAAALESALPWLADEPGAAVHRLNLSAGTQTLLSRRTRLVLRLPRERVAQAAAVLAGATLELGGEARIVLGAARERELLPFGTLYAHLVASDADDEALFMQRVQAELAAAGVACRAICGRPQSLDAGALRGYGLMLDGLSVEHSRRVLHSGLGAHRRLGCGVFVPHKSALAVGQPQ